MFFQYKKLSLIAKGATMLALGTLALTFTACDNVDEEDRFIKVERPVVARKVLIQEFTGQNCINCPLGAATVHSLQEQYPGSIIAVNLHPENNVNTRPMGGLKLTSPLATVYYQHYQPSGFPAAVIDGATPIEGIDLWTAAVLNALKQESAADLSLSTEYDSTNRELKVTYHSHFNKIYDAPLTINIWIIENDIIGPQMSGHDIIFKYIHNHVLRTSLTGDWGVAVADSFIPEDDFTATFTITLDESWVAENCEVVGFLQNPSSKSIEQSSEAPVINK